METRKVQLIGGSTYTVSLPKQWASEHSIRAGDRLRLYPHEDGSLLVRGENDPIVETGEARTTEVTTDDRSPTDVSRTVQALYQAGFDGFTLSGSRSVDTRTRRTIGAVTRWLIGLEVLEETEIRTLLQSLWTPPTSRFAKRLFSYSRSRCRCNGTPRLLSRPATPSWRRT